MLLVYRIRRHPIGEFATSAKNLWVAARWIIPGLLVAYFPVLLWGQHFLGRFKTDLFLYAGAVGDVSSSSFLGLRSSRLEATQFFPDIGFVWRSIDTVSASAVALLPGISSPGAFVVLGIALFLLFGLATIALTFECGLGKGSRIAVSLMLFGPLFGGLYLENYVSQYFLIAIIPGLVLALTRAVSSMPDGSRLPYAIVTAAALAAAAIAVYPYMAIPILAAAVGTLVMLRSGRSLLKAHGVALVAIVFLAANAALLPLLQSPTLSRYDDSLNAITRNVLVPAFSNVDLLGFGLGIRSYQFRPVDIPAEEWMGTVGQVAWELSQRTTSVTIPALLCVALMAFAFLATVDWGAAFRTPAFLLSFSTILVLVLLALHQSSAGSVYNALKLGWSAGALLPLGIATATVHRRRSWLLAVSAIPIAAMWATVDVADRITYVLPRSSLSVAFGHERLEPDIAKLSARLVSSDGPTALARGQQSLSGTDLDRVAAAHLRSALRDQGGECHGCLGVTDLTSLENLQSDPDCAEGRLGVVVLVGRSEFSRMCGLPLDERAQLMEIYRR